MNHIDEPRKTTPGSRTPQLWVKAEESESGLTVVGFDNGPAGSCSPVRQPPRFPSSSSVGDPAPAGGSDPAIAGGRSVVRGENSTGGTTSSKREAVQGMTEVGGVRSSDDPAPGPAVAGFGQPAEERRDATCSAEMKSSEGRGDGPRGLQALDKRSATANHDGRRVSAFRQRNSEDGCGKIPTRRD
jgi:hypothetical protein